MEFFGTDAVQVVEEELPDVSQPAMAALFVERLMNMVALESSSR